MKKNNALILAAMMMLLALTACGGKGGSGDKTPASDSPVATPEATEPAATPEATEPAATPEATEPAAPSSNHVVDYKVDIPEGFEETQMAGLDANWQNADNSSINLTITDATSESDFESIDAEMLKQAMDLQYKAAGFEAEFTDRYFTKDKVCGLPAYQYCFDVTLNGVDMTQIMVCVNADKTYSFSYTDASGNWLDQFEASAKNIQLTVE